MSQYEMNQLVQKMYKEKYEKVKEEYLSLSVAYIRKHGIGDETTAPCLSDVT